jgi:hypothetical protein
MGADHGKNMLFRSQIKERRLLVEMVTEQIRNRVERLQAHGWLTFEGRAAMELLRKVIHVRNQPILIVHCERKLGSGTHDYEYFIPISACIDYENEVIGFGGTIGPNGDRQMLYWDPEKTFDASGTFISYVSTLAKFFPSQEVNAVKLAELSF